MPMAETRDAQKQEPDETAGFEVCLERIESIIERIEMGECGLEDSLAEYERGVKLLKRCREMLKTAEQRVEELSERPGSEGPGGAGADDEAAPF